MALLKVTMGVFGGTVRANPKETVWASSGTRCRRKDSSVSIAAGLRLVARCSRALMWVMNSSHAASNSAKELYASRRFVSLGTMSALATFTAFSTPPLEAGSAG